MRNKLLTTGNRPRIASGARRPSDDFRFLTPDPRPLAPGKRRGTVLIMVIGVLAILFVMGSTLMIVARFERGVAETKDESQQLKAVSLMVTEPILAQLREDIVGTDGEPYNSGWAAPLGNGDSSLIEDGADFSGLITPTPNMRNGDLLLSSSEPFYNGTNWQWFSSSWVLDAVPLGATYTNSPVSIGPTYGPKYDADGDGLRDSGDSGGLASLSAMFGGGYWLEFRVVPHSGMVLIDPFTHPSLLAQAIHPTDQVGITTGTQMQAFVNSIAIDVPTDEAAIRRRFSLPRQLARTDPNSLDVKLPVSMEYPANNSQHWWPFDDKVQPADGNAWQIRFTPGSANPPTPGTSGAALTDATYSAADDKYDRRHLMTTASSDDILRPKRDEVKLQIPLPLFYEVLNPAADPLTDSGSGFAPPVYFDYGRDSTGILQFNGAGLRTAFSLRDVLVEPLTNQASDPFGTALGYGMHASYRRAVQLTAYYLAMIQHTTVPLAEQLRTAAQLAVNTIDFADFDDPDGDLIDNNTPTIFAWPPTGIPQVQVAGIEKQPYITEAYVKIALHAQESDATQWDTIPSVNAVPANQPITIYAVELYNPYDVPIDLRDYILQGQDLLATFVAGTPLAIQPHSYVVIANQFNDPLLSPPDLIPASVVATVEYPLPSWNVIKVAGLAIAPGQAVTLTRKTTCLLTPTSVIISGGSVIVDILAPVGLGGLNTDWARLPMDPAVDKYVDDPANPNLGVCSPTPSIYDIRRPGQALSGQPASDASTPATDWLVRDSSLQRHKETAGQPPLFWHATLARQILFPLPLDIEKVCPPTSTTWDSFITDYKGRQAQHDLLRSGTTFAYCKNQEWVDREFKGMAIDRTPNNLSTPPFIDPKMAIAPFPVLVGPARFPESPHNYPDNYMNEWTYTVVGVRNLINVTFDAQTITTAGDLIYIMDSQGNQIVGSPFSGSTLAGSTVQVPGSTVRIAMTSDTSGTDYGFKVTDIVGSDGSRNYLAFPTTGSLLLVTRYAHDLKVPADLTDDLPASVAATQVPVGVTGRVGVETNFINLPGQMQLLDNGHLPIIDGKVYDAGGTLLTAGQTCTDLTETQGRLDGPWGQLIYDYFTALPLEELVEPRNLTFLVLAPPPPNPVRMTALPDDQYSYVYRLFFPDYPLNGRAVGSNTVGPMVKGRINVNFAPWWVLDGLPMTSHSPSLPVPELQYNYLDPVTLAAPPLTPPPVPVDYQRRPGLLFSTMSVDENSIAQNGLQGGYSRPPNPNPPLDLPSSSPTMSKAIVGYRENRNVDSVILANNLPTQHPPGMLTVGQLADVLRRIPLTVATAQNTGAPNTVENTVVSLPLNTLRDYSYNNDFPNVYTMEKPFAYLGYLQLVAPMVRLQDWVTVKNHVFTIYTTIRTTSSPEINMRTQVTIDRTRCLYTKDLPARIAEIEPIGYYNAIDD